MRYGMPPTDAFNTQWLVRDLRGKSEKNFWSYVSLFMRHLCEPGADHAETFADGVPREGISRQHVLTRIGVMSLIRKKVQEFEHINGSLQNGNGQQSSKLVNGNGVTAGDGGGDAAPKLDNGTKAEGASGEKKNEAQTSGESGDGAAASASADVVVKTEGVENEDQQQSGEAATEGEAKSGTTAGRPNETNDKENKENIQLKTPKEEGGAAGAGGKERKRKFMFNIADGGFTELHALWSAEEKAITSTKGKKQHQQNNSKELELWNRRHDYWLLAGIIKHGYGRWQDIMNDAPLYILNEVGLL